MPLSDRDVVSLRLWSMGDEAEYMAAGNVPALSRLFQLRPEVFRARLAVVRPPTKKRPLDPIGSRGLFAGLAASGTVALMWCTLSLERPARRRQAPFGALTRPGGG